jgi:V/A-type H+-transporting ATPase subunit F
MKIFVIGEEEMVLGFSLLGIAGATPRSAEELLRLLHEHHGEGGLALILLEERVAELAPEAVAAYKARRGLPLLVELPGPQGPLERKGIKEFIAGAIGVRL